MADPWRIEAWTEYGIGVLVLLLRYFARWKAVGFKGWEGDDFVALFVLVCWTIVVYMLDQIVRHGTNRGITDEIGASLTSEQIARLEFGSKCLVVGRNFYVALIWSLKACILCFYNRIVRGLRQQVFVKWAGVACVFAYAGVMAAIWADCTPARKHWQVVPYPGDECTLSKTYYVVLLVLNVTTDIAIVSIPFLWLPMLRITLSRKIAIGVLVCSGVFIIIAAILRCVLTMLDLASIYITCMWAVREPFVAIIAVNAPVIKPLFSKSRWFTSRNGGSPTPGSQNHDSSSLNNLRGPDTIDSTPKSVFNRSADTTDMELGENSLEYNTWLKNEISASSSSIGESNCGADAKGITVATSTRVEVSPGKPGHIVGTTDTQIS